MSWHRTVRLSVLTLAVLGIALGLTALMPPQKASADICSINGRDCWFGYFFGGYDGGPGVRRNNVLRAPALLNIGNADNLVVTMSVHLGNCPGGGLWNQNDQNATGAAFIILTMLGAPPGTPKNEACRRFAEWRDYMYQYESLGLINFNQVYDFGGINTRSSVTDVAYYPSNGAAPSIVIYSPVTGLPIYAIKRDCGNPIGHLQGFQPLTYNLAPNVAISPGGTVEPGTSINANYTITNWPAQRGSGPATCTIYIIDRPGYVAGTPLPGPGDPAQNFACPPLGIGGSYAVPAGGAFANFTAQANRTHCRRLVVTPSNQAGASAAHESCVVVVNKPYVKVFGGDVAAGSGFGASCTSDTRAAVIGWNKRVAGAGAGTQFAGYALNVLQDFATSQINTGIATPPTGLSFSNQSTNAGAGLFGTTFGTSLPCLPDYFSQKPAGAPVQTSPINVSSLTTGAYSASGSVRITGGNVNPNMRTVLYVDDDVYIDNNITYVGSWNTNSAPLFKLVVRGNIFVAGTVSRLDGVYIAQPNGAAGGVIYTCTDPANPFAAMALTSVFNQCNSKLVVNGSFSARHVELLRSIGSLVQSSAGESSGSNNAGEVFNYSPAFWLAQPPDGTSTDTSSDTYDSIVSLPPVL